MLPCSVFYECVGGVKVSVLVVNFIIAPFTLIIRSICRFNFPTFFSLWLCWLRMIESLNWSYLCNLNNNAKIYLWIFWKLLTNYFLKNDPFCVRKLILRSSITRKMLKPQESYKAQKSSPTNQALPICCKYWRSKNGALSGIKAPNKMFCSSVAFEWVVVGGRL